MNFLLKLLLFSTVLYSHYSLHLGTFEKALGQDSLKSTVGNDIIKILKLDRSKRNMTGITNEEAEILKHKSKLQLNVSEQGRH